MSTGADSGRAPSYEPSAVEARRQASWEARGAFATPAAPDESRSVDASGLVDTSVPVDASGPVDTRAFANGSGFAHGGSTDDAGEGRSFKYVKPSAPFTSGNIHMGHVRSYSIGDAYVRFLRARGDAVLFAFGFDAFGLPAELGAIANGVSPTDWVSGCAEHMTGQLQRLGFSFDWERTFMSSDPSMYRWSQWLFLTLLEAGLIYHGTGNVDWCDTCQTTLATIQVEDGLCWRCHNPVRLIQRPQWYLRISAYLEENDRRLEDFEDWDENSLASQRFVLGRVDGVELDVPTGEGAPLTVFTPHGDALASARFILISPKHPDVERWASDPEVQSQLEEIRSGGWQRSSRGAESIPLVDTGHALPAPAGGAELPVLISPIVDGRFGVTAVFGVPEQDRTDAVIAERLPPFAEDASDESNTTEPGADGPTPRTTVRYRANDFSVSRQRSWGTPIPIVHCEDCGTVPVPIEQLPVRLPLELKPVVTGNPLAEDEEFVQTTCPSCGKPARRETDTLDCHFDALWLWVPACVPAEHRERPLEQIFALPELRRWLPSERLVAGSDSGNFVFDQRIVTKALRDLGPLSFLADGEPFAGCLFHEMVISDGRKMSKHLGNVVDPDELVKSFGADTVRLAILYAARPQKSLNWSESALQFCHRFLNQLWRYSQNRFTIDPVDDVDAESTEFLRTRLTKWCDTALEKITEDLESLDMHKAVRNVIRLFDRIKDFESKVQARNGGLGVEDHTALVDALALMAQVITPFAPHLGEELWLASGRGVEGAAPPWPSPTANVVTSGGNQGH